MRRLLVLIVLILIFAGLLALSRSRASWQHNVVSGDTGTLLYAATFDGESEPSSADGFNDEWAQYSGRLSTLIKDGKMQVTIGEAGGGAYSTASPYFGDFDLRVDAQAVGGPIDNGYGVVFRLQNKDNASFDDDNYYLFLISSDGYYQMSRTVDGVVKIISDWIASDAIQQGLDSVNHLRVVARGDTFHFYVNEVPLQLCIPDDPDAISTYSGGECVGGAMVDALTDDAIPNGQIGVTAQSTPSGGEGVVVAFDNLLVYAP